MKKLLLFLSVGSLIGVSVQPIVACKNASRKLSIGENTILNSLEKEIKDKKYISGDFVLIVAKRLISESKVNYIYSRANEPTEENEVFVELVNEEISSTISNEENRVVNTKLSELNLIVRTAIAVKQNEKLVWSEINETKIPYKALYGNNTIPIDDLQKKLDIYKLDISQYAYNEISKYANDFSSHFNELLVILAGIVTDIWNDKTNPIKKFMDEYNIKDYKDLLNQSFKFDEINKVEPVEESIEHIHVKATMQGKPPESLFSGSVEIDLFVKK